MDINTQLKEVCDILSPLVDAESIPSAIFPDPHFRESVMIGTSSSLIRVAITIIQAIVEVNDGRGETDCLVDEKGHSSCEVRLAFFESAPCWPVCVFIAPDESSASRVTERIREMWCRSNPEA